MFGGRPPSENEMLQADLCIIGAGVAGIALAREFIGGSTQVLLVESGDASPKPETQELSEGEVTGKPYFDLDRSCRRGVGGSSWGWCIELPDGRTGARFRALDAIDFEERPEIPYSGWPIALSDLEPFYQQAHEFFEIGPYTNHENYHSSSEAPLLPTRGHKIETTIFRFADARLLTDKYPRELRQAPNITILTNTTVLELETNASADQVRAARSRTLTGASIRIESSQFVVAAGGLQTPRLLLLSDRHQPEGLGNQHDLVGRFFMEHLHNGAWSPGAGLLIPSGRDPSDKLRLYHRIQEENGTAFLGYLTPKADALRAEGLANYCCHFKPDSELDYELNPYHFTEGYESFRHLVYAACGRADLPDRPSQSLWSALKGIPDVGQVLVDKLAGRAHGTGSSHVDTGPRSFGLFQMAEQTPNPESRVTLGSEKDAFGQPRVRLDWQFQPRDFRSIQRAQQLVAAAIEECGAGRLLVPSLDEIRETVNAGGHHHMGTTRMSERPKSGVVDSNCKVHGVDNLYIAGPSVFPTAGCANPTLTIVALSIRLADYLQETMD